MVQIIPTQTLSSPTFIINKVSATISTKIRIFSSKSRLFFDSPIDLNDIGNGRNRVLRVSSKVRDKVSSAELKEKWLTSLSTPLHDEPESNDKRLVEWVIWVDPDVSGALALLRSDDFGCSAQSHVRLLVDKTMRRRLDTRSIVQLLWRFDAPPGTTAYVEQSTPFPTDGKQSGGFGYGIWTGVLVASGFSVVPVSSLMWKNHFELAGSRLSKDDSRKTASTLFPSLSSQLTRKKDHGRAEALLTGAYGKGLVLKSEELLEPEALLPKSEECLL
ncbi:hypothetical protein MKX01_028533 [Papaver californicum]|nr:hypothetical protein MKX01_028533 [Papaver californicum]